VTRYCPTVTENCKTEEELEFLFPELTRIHNPDLAVLEVWQNQMDWARSLSPSEQQLLASADFNDAEEYENGYNSASLAKPSELTLYEELQPKSHPASRCDQLKLLFSSSLRRQDETPSGESFRGRLLDLTFCSIDVTRQNPSFPSSIAPRHPLYWVKR
jgi:hypothetical protein